ncbi:MAG TPA: 4-amino-4-deoxy-L-arabinose transferase [Nocardioides sp.]|nr:4-amino-4-deoxy-L-arabinose transferase [Nocardioides sp.]
MPGTAMSAAHRVLELALARPATLGDGRLVCIDGPAGSGKTTLADQVAALSPGTLVVHTDDLLAGWDGLPGLPATIETLLRPLAAGAAGSYRRFDWHADRRAEAVPVPPRPLLVLEGVGAGALPTARFATLLVWVEAPYDVRMRRGLDRDGDVFAPHWEKWSAAEVEHFARHRTRERADLHLDGEGRLVG